MWFNKHKQLQQSWDLPEHQLKSLSVILSGLCFKLFQIEAINFLKYDIKGHSHIELLFNEHTFTAFCINLKEPIITHISYSDFCHTQY